MIFKVSVHNARLEIPKDPNMFPPALASLVASCWESIPETRPNAEEVLNQLEVFVERMMQEVGIPTV